MSLVADAISALLDVGKHLKSLCEGAEAAVKTAGNVSDSLRQRRELAVAREVVAGLFRMVELRIELSNAIRSYALAISEQKGEATEIRERNNVEQWAEGLDKDIRGFKDYKNYGLRPDIVVILMRLMDASKKLIQALKSDAAGLERLAPNDLIVVAEKLDLIREALESISMEVWSIEHAVDSEKNHRISELFQKAGITDRATALIHLEAAEVRALDIELDSIWREAKQKKESLTLESGGKNISSRRRKKKSSEQNEP